MDKNIYYDKTLGGWLGKNIGGTLGGPWEGHTSPLLMYYYDPVPKEAMPNDDFELQLVWLDMLRKNGIYLKPADFVYHWQEHTRYYISEYFMGQRNMALGLLPPVTGAFNNWWISGMGATIRSEIWGMIAPGMPEIAAAYAYMDASTDHSEEGVDGEVFFAALESYAYVENDIRKLISKGLEFIPAHSVIRKVVMLVLEELERGREWRSIRHLLCAEFAHPTDFTYAPLNAGFTVLGLLSSTVYDEILCNTVNCGYDTDCTGATAGAALGIMRGASNTPKHWLEPIGYPVVVSDLLVDVDYPADIRDVTEQVCALGEQVLENSDRVREHLYRWTRLPFLCEDKQTSWKQSPSEITLGWNGDLGVYLTYMDSPAIGLGETQTHVLHIENKSGKNLPSTLVVQLQEGSSHSGDNGLAKIADCQIELPEYGSVDVPLTVHIPPETTVEGPTLTIQVALKSEGQEPLQFNYAVVFKAAWKLTDALDSDDMAVQIAIEKAGSLENVPVDVNMILHGSDDLTDFIPSVGKVVYVQTVMYAQTETPVRVIANNTGPIRVFHNGKCIINKEHWLAGIAPSWHLQAGDGSTHLLPKNGGFADITMSKGENILLFRLEGHDRLQDATFHLAQIVAPDHASAKMGDYRPATSIYPMPS